MTHVLTGFPDHNEDSFRQDHQRKELVYFKNYQDSPTEARYEDQIIARTWRYYIQGIIDDPNVVLPVPMVKVSDDVFISWYTSSLSLLHRNFSIC